MAESSADSLKHARKRMFQAVRSAQIDRLDAALSSLTDKQVAELVNTPYTNGVASVTPLIMASMYGHVMIVQRLISKYKADLEVEGVVVFEKYPIQGTTALWCASSHGHLETVVYLVQTGKADVNHSTRSLSTPLRAACFNGRLHIVQYLVENGADYNLANKFDNTCLMIAAYNGHLDVVKFLLRLQLDSNRQAKCGSTALHFAAENGHLEVAKCLISFGAKMIRNSSGKSKGNDR
jgi:Fem-1 family protein b